MEEILMLEQTGYQNDYLNRAAVMAAAPSTHFRPRVFPDGNRWCALYGEDLQNGVAGFGKTPEGAIADFDHNWISQTLHDS